LKLHLQDFSKIKSHKDVTKQKDIRLFLLFLPDHRRIRIRISTSYFWILIRIQEAQKHTAPDPKHLILQVGLPLFCSKKGKRLEMRPHACGLLCGLCKCCGTSRNIDALAFYEDLEERVRMEIEQEQVNLQDKTIGELTLNSLV
jgi:hypothetical protein